LVPGKKICTPAVEKLDRVLQMVIDLVFLDHEKGRVR
jgi:predicted O-methyltransferase YrrM